MSSRQLFSEQDRIFRDHAVKVAAAAAACLATAAFATAAPVTPADTPTGDVWVTHVSPTPAPAQAAQNAPSRGALPTGDFWPADEGATRTADTPSPPQDAVAYEEGATGSTK